MFKLLLIALVIAIVIIMMARRDTTNDGVKIQSRENYRSCGGTDNACTDNVLRPGDDLIINPFVWPGSVWPSASPAELLSMSDGPSAVLSGPEGNAVPLISKSVEQFRVAKGSRWTTAGPQVRRESLSSGQERTTSAVDRSVDPPSVDPPLVGPSSALGGTITSDSACTERGNIAYGVSRRNKCGNADTSFDLSYDSGAPAYASIQLPDETGHKYTRAEDRNDTLLFDALHDNIIDGPETGESFKYVDIGGNLVNNLPTSILSNRGSLKFIESK
jgi:hypothetical protein